LAVALAALLAVPLAALRREMGVRAAGRRGAGAPPAEARL